MISCRKRTIVTSCSVLPILAVASAVAQSRLPVKSQPRAGALVTGDVEHLAGTVAGTTPTMVVEWSPSPEGGTASNYPPGTTLSLTELTAPLGGFNAVFNLWLSNWDPDGDGVPLLRTWQTKIGAVGFRGVNALPPNDGCDLTYPLIQSCSVSADCTAAFEAGSRCASGTCEWAFQSQGRSDWLLRTQILEGCPITPAVNQSSLSGPVFAATTDPGCEKRDEGLRYYAGTLYLGVPACAKGTYTMGYVLGFDTFFQDGQNPAQDIPVAEFIEGKLTIPVGSCCTDIGLGGGCTDDITQGECEELGGANPHVWREGVSCATACPACEVEPCPVGIVSTTPPLCAIDARYPHDPASVTPRLGFNNLLMQFNLDPGALTCADFTLSAVPSGPGLVTCGGVNCNSSLKQCTMTFTNNNAIQTSKWTCVQHNASTDKACIGALPADADSSRASAPLDVDAIMDHLDASIALDIWECDIDRSTRCAPPDIIAALDLLNGAGLFAPFNSVSLPICPSVGIP